MPGSPGADSRVNTAARRRANGVAVRIVHVALAATRPPSGRLEAERHMRRDTSRRRRRTAGGSCSRGLSHPTGAAQRDVFDRAAAVPKMQLVGDAERIKDGIVRFIKGHCTLLRHEELNASPVWYVVVFDRGQDACTAAIRSSPGSTGQRAPCLVYFPGIKGVSRRIR